MPILNLSIEELEILQHNLNAATAAQKHLVARLNAQLMPQPDETAAASNGEPVGLSRIPSELETLKE